MDRMVQEFKELKLGIRSTVNDAMAASLAIQGRGNLNTTESSPHPKQQIFIPHPAVLTLLREFLGDPAAVFKAPEQAMAIEVVLAGERHVLLVGATGVGKTLVYQLPAALRDHGITCVLLPLSALHLDFDRRCKDLKIPSSRWLPGVNERPETRIVYVSPEHAQTAKFGGYLIEMARLEILKQFVIDEAHLLPLHSGFRFCLSALRPLVSSGKSGSSFLGTISTLRTGVPFLLMTATCPPSLRSRLLSYLGLVDCHVIHAPTDRPEISYNVKLYPTLDKARDKLVSFVQRQLELAANDSSFRGLVYCRSKDQVEELASMIGCKPFHASRPVEERAVSFQDWVDGKQKFMVCTSLLGCGIDVEGVCAVYHFGTPWSIPDFAQESGRGGRSGNRSISMVFASHDEREPEDDDDLYGKKTMREWVLQRSQCRRITLSSFLDEGRTTCVLLKGASLCDVCRAQSKEEHPKKLVEFPTQTILDGDIPRSRSLPHVPPTSLSYEMGRTVELAPHR